MVKDLIVVGEIVAGNDIGTGLLLGLPVGSTESLSDLQELSLRDLSAPVSFGSFLELTVGSHAGEPENGSIKKTSVYASRRTPREL